MAEGSPAQRFKCTNCSADMEFDPASGGLKCPYCGTAEAVVEQPAKAVSENPIDQVDPARFGKLSDKALQVECSTCGSIVEFEPPEVAGFCPFCAAKIVVQAKSADPLISPDALLPFSVPKDNASGQLRQWLASRWFAPSDLNKLAQPDGLSGMYLPFWTFDAEALTSYSGERGEYYFETEYILVRDANGRESRQARQVRHTRWYAASGRVEDSFDDILIPATKSVDRGKLDALDPWDLPSLRPYEPAYLAGFKAQRYQAELPEAFESAKGRMEAAIRQTVLRAIGGDEQRIHSMTPQYSNITFKHLLLPVWLGVYRYQGKVYQVLVNARTGEVQGERPYSAGKIALAVIAAIILLIVIFAISR
jgi:DNA-directed RNA polymerase subunit RPC12/RpoP